MLFFHAFVGCDVVSAFRGNGKNNCMTFWSKLFFSKLSKYPLVVSEHSQIILEMFVITMHDRSSPTADIDDARLFSFARKQRSYESIPPTRGALVDHTERAAYNAGCIWGQATICKIVNESPGDCG